MDSQVPASYPLRIIDVVEDEASRKLRSGIREEKWRLWPSTYTYSCLWSPMYSLLWPPTATGAGLQLSVWSQKTYE